MSRSAEYEAPWGPLDPPGLSNALPQTTNNVVPRGDPQLLATLRNLPRKVALAVIAVGGLVLIGWSLDIALLKSVVPEWVAMQPSTALAFILTGACLYAMQFRVDSRRVRVAALGTAVLVSAIGLLTMSEQLFGWDLGIDLLLFKKVAPAAPAAGQMAPATAFSFFLLGICLGILAAPGKRCLRCAQVLALFPLVVSTLAVTGYAYDVDSLYRLAPYTAMAFHTAIAFAALSVGIVSAAAARLDTSLLASRGAGGAIVRGLLPPGLAILFLLGWARLAGEMAGFYGTPFELAFMVTSAMILLAGIVWHAAWRLERAEIQRTHAVARTHETRRMLEDLLASAAEGVVSADENLRIVLCNGAAEQIFGRSREDMIGQPLNVLIPEGFRARHDNYVRQFAATGQFGRSMGRYGLIYGVRASGEEFPLEATISQSGTAPGKLFTVILRDISERLRTEQAIHVYAERLRQLSRRLLEVEESERRRLARQLHDSIGQNVTALTINLDIIRSELPGKDPETISTHLDDCETLLYSTGQLVRDVMADLRPPGLDELGLLAALTEHARKVSVRSGFSVTVRGTEIIPRPAPTAEIMLFRIAQEALVNIAKHARATEVIIHLEWSADTVVLTVADNGRGFDPATRLAEALGHLGVVSMRERAESIGGQLKIESVTGRGSRVIVEAPRGSRS